MTLEDVVRELIQCLGSDGDTTLTWEQVRAWPKGAVDVLQEAGWIKPTYLGEMVECPGCEEKLLHARACISGAERAAHARLRCL